MAWRIEFGADARKDLARLDAPVARRITSLLRERVATSNDPRSLGQALKGSSLGELWKCRVGDWRIIASIEDGAVRVLVVRIGNRREVCR